MKQNIYNLFAKVQSNKTAIVYRNESISFGEVKKAAETLSKLLLKLGCNETSVVGFLLNDTPDFIISLLAISGLNAKFFVLNPKNPSCLIEKILSTLKPRIIIADPLIVSQMGVFVKFIKTVTNFSSTVYLLELNTEERKISDGTFAILFTSGTTQLPKGVFHLCSEKCFSVWEIKEAKSFFSNTFIFCCYPKVYGYNISTLL